MMINQHNKAEEYFHRVLSDYPDGKIEPTSGQREFGRTAAKALLALTEIAKLKNSLDDATGFSEALKDYPDSYVLIDGDVLKKVSFHELSQKILQG